MNTTITVTAVVDDNADSVSAYDALEKALGEFDRIVEKFTRFEETSELSKLNAERGKWVDASAEMIMLVQKMLDLTKATNGAFDPTIIDFLEMYGYKKGYDFSALNDPELKNRIEKRASQRPSWEEIQIDTAGSRIKLHTDQRIDLGGIGKGYAIDCAAARLKEAGITNFLIDGGGDMYAEGKNKQGENWTTALKHKHEDEELFVGSLQLEGSAVASSGSWARKVQDFHHIINPGSGKPIEGLSTIFVTAPTSLESDGWATALFVGGKELLENLPENLGIMMIYEDGKVVMNEVFKSQLDSPAHN